MISKETGRRNPPFSLYTEEGWMNFSGILENTTDYPIVIINGGRGTGKTFGALQYVRQHPEIGMFLYLRRTQSQLDIINKQEFSPFTDVDRVTGMNTIAVPLSKYNAGYYNATEAEENKWEATGALLGMSAALSTISNIRSFRSAGITILIYDEYIPESHDRPLRDEAGALFNAYETINRNRELSGKAPLKMFLMANTNRIDSPILERLGIMNTVAKMEAQGRDRFLIPDRGIAIFSLLDSPISGKKKNTALYRAIQGDRMAEMSLNNKFTDIDWSRIKPQNIKNLLPMVVIDGLCIYRRKDHTGYFVTDFVTGSPPLYNSQDEIRKGLVKYNFLFTAYMADKIRFGSMENLQKFKRLFKI